MRRLLLIAALLCASLGHAEAQVEGSATFSIAGTTREEVVTFLGKLQKAVQAEDRATVAALVHFPLRAWSGKATTTVRDRRQFLALYPAIFTASLKKTIADARVEQAFANWQGVMFARGRFWLRPDDTGALGIVTINRPAP